MVPLPNCNWRKQISWLFLSLACYASVLCPVLLGDVSGCANTIPTNLVQAACLRGTQRSALLGVLFVVAGRVGVKDPAAPNDLNLVAPLAVFSNHDRFGFRVHGFRNSDRRISAGGHGASRRGRKCSPLWAMILHCAGWKALISCRASTVWAC
jgi:hypothetical protein